MNERISSHLPTKYFTQKVVLVDDWMTQLNGYDLRLWHYEHECSRLTLKAIDRIAKRSEILIVFHDVSYIEMPLHTGKVKVRDALKEERGRVQHAMGNNFNASNVIALCATEKRVFLIEYGYMQLLTARND